MLRWLAQQINCDNCRRPKHAEDKSKIIYFVMSTLFFEEYNYRAGLLTGFSEINTEKRSTTCCNIFSSPMKNYPTVSHLSKNLFARI